MRLPAHDNNEPEKPSEQTVQPLSPGDRLRQARETKGLTLEQVSAVTRISVAILKAIENGETDNLRSAVAIRGFVKIYAEHVGLDSSEFISAWTKTEPRKKQAAQPSVTSKKLMQSEAFAERTILLSGKQFLPVLFIVLLLFIGFIIYRAYFSDSANDIPQEETSRVTPNTPKKPGLQFPTPSNPMPVQPSQQEKPFPPQTSGLKQHSSAFQSGESAPSPSQGPPDSYTTNSDSNQTEHYSGQRL